MGCKRSLLLSLLVLAGTTVWAAPPAEMVKINLNPSSDGAVLVLSHKGSAKFRVFQSEKQQTVIVEAENLSLPAQLTRAINVAAAGGPVLSLTPYNSLNGGKSMAKLVLRMHQKAELSSSELPGKFVLTFRKQAHSLPYIGKQAVRTSRTSWSESDALTGTQSANQKSEEIAKKLIEVLESTQEKKQYFGSRVTFEANQADVHDIFRLVGETSGLNIVSDNDVNAKANFSLKDIPWDQLLDVVIQQNMLKAAVVGNVVRIMTLKSYNDAAELKKKELTLGDDLEPVIMAVIPLGFADAGKMKAMIQGIVQNRGTIQTNNPVGPTAGPGGPVSSATNGTFVQDFIRGKIELDERSNSLVITDTKDAIERIRRLVKELDVPLPQILIDAKIVIADEKFSEQIGVNWGFATVSDSNRAGFGSSFNQTTTTSGATPGFSTGTAGQAPAFTVSGIPNGLGISAAIGNTSRASLNASLQLAELNSMSRTVAAPRVIVNNKEKAQISDGQSITLLVPGGAGGASTSQTVNADLQLNVTPQVTSHGSVQMKVDITKDAINGSTSTTADKSTKHLTTDVLVDSGSTLVLGGVFQSLNTKGESGIPLLKDLPFIGSLFKVNSNSTTKSELMVFITPQILDPEGASQTL